MTGALLERHPALADRLRPLSLGSWPTPVERIEGLPGLPRVWVKRDDLSAATYGGSKVRNLEWILADARRRGARGLLTSAAWGSHLVLALAVHGGASGFDVRAVLFPQPLDEEVLTTLRRVHAAGARVSRARSYLDVPIRVAAQALAMRRAGSGWPYWVAAGGASPIGCLGYLQAGLELRAQIEAGLLPSPDYVYCAAGSCGTLVGLSEGLALAGIDATVVGVRVVPRFVTSAVRRGALHRGLRRVYRELTGERLLQSPRSIVVHDQVGRGYARGTEEASQAAAVARGLHGLQLEETYTAKALAGLLAYARERELGAASHLFLDTFDGRLPNASEVGELPPAFQSVRM